MMYHPRIPTCVLFCLVLLILGARCVAQVAIPPEEEAVQQAVLLTNDRVLQGAIRRDGDFYLVGLPHGELRVRAAEVAAVGRDLHDLYRHKCQLVERCGGTERLRLALWCHANGLLAEAGEQLEYVRQTEPTHDGIALVQRRLAATLTPFRAVSSSEPQADSLPNAAGRGPGGASAIPLERLPRGSVEAFARSIQPLLANRCATSGCHDTQSETEFAMRPLLAGRLPSQHVTQANLQAVLPWIDADEPSESPLLTAAFRPHGPLRSGVLAASQTDNFQRLALWTEYVARGIDRLSSKSPPPVGPSSDVRRITFEEPLMPPGELPEAEEIEDPFDDGVFEAKPAVQRGAPVETVEFADPFDPEAFNRRHFPKSYRSGGK